MDSGRVTGSGDVIATLSARVGELSKRVSLLQAELEAAQKRVAVYEEHDSTIQDALSGALRAAYTIRERAETTAEQILEQAREERRMLLKEIERLREERDAVQQEIAERRRGGLTAVTPRPLTSDSAAQELRAVASEALRGLFQEIVEDIRSAPPPPPAAARPATMPPAAEPEPKRPLRAPEPPRVAEAPRAAEPPRVHEPPRFVEPVQPAAVRAPEPPTAAPVEDVDVAPPAAAAPAAPPLEVVPPLEIEEIAPARVEAASPTSDIQLVLSPIASFPRLVEIERHIQALPVVRTLYVRDFRGGAATLAVALRSAMTPSEFAGMLGGLAEPRMRLVSGSRNTLELRIEGEASIA